MIKEDVENTNDYELIMLYRENDENAKNILYIKYKFIIDIIIKKYNKYIHKFNIDYQEVYSECTVGFSDALRCFQDDKNSSLPTFITLCIERRLHNLIKKYTRSKHLVEKDSLSLDFNYDNNDKLIDYISDYEYEPLTNMTNHERYNDLINNIKSKLSSKEYDVFVLMTRNLNYIEIAKILGVSYKQVDNAIQRIKIKVRDIIS